MSSTTQLDTFAVADIGTAHITEADDRLLKEDAEWYVDPMSPADQAGARLHVCPKDSGWWIYVSDDTVMREDARPLLLQRGYSEALLDLIDLVASQDNKCSWVCLDANGIEYPGLPTFDW